MSFVFITSKEWCTEVADALLPHMIQVLPRNRWVNSLTAFRDYAILTVHNILQRAGLRWLDKLSGKQKLEPVPRPEPGAVGGSRATLAVEAGSEGWVLSDSEQEGDRQEQPEELEEELREDGEEKQTTPNETFRGSERDWNIFNSEQRGKANTFLEKGLCEDIIVGLIALQISVCFLRHVEHVSSQKWARAQERAYTTTGRASSRMQEAASGRLKTSTMELAAELLENPDRWRALPPTYQTVRSASSAFAMISTIICSLAHLAWQWMLMYPVRMWLLLERPTLEMAQEIVDDPICLKDKWTLRFLKAFPTAELLLKQGLPILVALAIILKWDIIGIECRNAALKRLMRSLGATHCPYIQDVSTDFLLMKQRLLERMWSRPPPLQRRGPRKRRPNFSKGGGGTARALVGRFLRGSKYKTQEERKQLLRAANDAAAAAKRSCSPHLQEAVREGVHATIAHRARGFQAPHKRKAGSASICTSEALALHNEITHKRQKREFELAAVVDTQCAIADWSAQMTPGTASALPEVLATPQAAPDFCTVPGLGVPGVDMEVVYWIPPGTEMARRVLGRSPPSFKAAVRQAWSQEHAQLKHATAPAIPPPARPPEKASACVECSRVGECISGRCLRIYTALRKALLDILKKKKGQPRSLVNILNKHAKCLIDIYTLDLQVRHIVHLGYGNLNQGAWTILCLSVLSEPPDERLGASIVLEAAVEPQQLEKVLLDSPTNVDWDFEVLQLSNDSRSLHTPFVPGIVRARCLVPRSVHSLWRVSEARPCKPLPLYRPQRLSLPLVAPIADDASVVEGDPDPDHPNEVS